MKTKKKPFSLKKIPNTLALILLTTGASLILGLLSFGGMYALVPALSLACATFILSVAYEGEIYLQNIKGALNKLFKNNHLQNHLAKEYLLTHFPENIEDSDCPQFFRDYKAQLQLLSPFDHKELDKESKKRKRHITKTLSDMEKWFALQLFSKQTKTPGDQTEYVKAVQSWLSKNQQDEWQKRIENRRTAFIGVKVFSALAAVFMGLGSTYLIVEAFAVIPFLAAIPFAFWPLMILPMAIIAGAAYGLLTYNTITDLINNNTVVKWYNKLRQDLSQGLTPRNLFLATTAVLLVGLAVALTVCTAGTWWTIATNSRPLFEWMTKMPSFIMGIINPIITGASAIFFNVQNSAESLDMVDEATRSTKNIFQRMYQYTANGIKHLRETENWLQMLNPFRILLKLTIAPLRLLFFMGHLISISLTADRMPGVPQILSALVGIISEGFEDAHYFIGHSAQDESTDNDGQEPKHDTKTLLKNRLDGDSEHNQSTDIPTWLLRTVAAPIYALAALWDSSTSQLNTKKIPQGGLQHQVPTPKTLSFSEAWDKQRGVTKEAVVSTCPETQRPSTAWQVEHATALIDRKAKKLEASTFNGALASDKVAHLQALKIKIRAATSSDSIEAALIEDQAKPVYNKHRMFALQNEKTDTQEFIEGLPDRIRLA